MDGIHAESVDEQMTEKVVKGFGAIQFREQQPNAMHEVHQVWLTTLKDRSEKH